jgi:IS30 family transposase
MPRWELRTKITTPCASERMPLARAVTRTGGIAHLLPLSERPVEADDRLVPGRWESDFIKAAPNASAIGTALERTSHFVLLPQMSGRTAAHGLEGFRRRFKGVIPELRETFTYDLGSEMAAPSRVHYCDWH